MKARGRIVMLAAALVAPRLGADQRAGSAADENERVIVMKAFLVRAGPVENFGFQVARGENGALRPVEIIAVLPHTAASKAGLRPGDTILNSDGRPVGRATRIALGAEVPWRGFYVPPEKRAALAEGREVSWTLEVRTHGARQSRTVTLTVPTPPPHWGAPTWVPPEGRSPATVSESGLLAERAKLILEQGVWVMVRTDLARNLPRRNYYYGYQWSVAPGRSMIVSQARERTDIIIQSGTSYYLTSPGGELERAVRNERVEGLDPWAEIPRATAEPALQAEIDFWTQRVGKYSARWPLELRRNDSSELRH